ncbi:MAG: type II toxin-antitoxin system Phd/YefM family antitoxin [Anaerolinea sp.]|nr:type II toxin-antitoxin system Phd/YefM family antitoxin [Anaerolinea sp.]
MGYVTVRDLRVRPGDVWEKLREQGEMILTSNGRPMAILAQVDETDVEATLAALRRARAQAAVARMRRAAAQMSEAEIDAEIDAVRRERPPGVA